MLPSAVRRSCALLIVLAMGLNFRCLTTAGAAIGDIRPIRKGDVGAVTGFVADLAVAVKVGGTAGAVYGGLVILFPIVLFLIFIRGGHPGDIEYPVFPRTAEGKALQKFVGTARTVLLVVDPGPVGSTELDPRALPVIPHKVFEAMDKESYYTLVDAEKRRDLKGRVTFDEILRDRAKIGHETSTQMILHVRFLTPTTWCSVEPMRDNAACTAAMVSQASGGAGGKGCELKPTAVRLLRLPMEGTLLRTDSNALIRAKADGPKIEARVFGGAGSRECPPALNAYDEAVNKSIGALKVSLSPQVKAMNLRIITKDPDPDVRALLEDGDAEIKGDTPSFDKAAVYWKKALELSGGKSIGALANLGTYYMSMGDFDKAVEFFQRAADQPGSDKNYWREMKKRAEAMRDP